MQINDEDPVISLSPVLRMNVGTMLTYLYYPTCQLPRLDKNHSSHVTRFRP